MSSALGTGGAARPAPAVEEAPEDDVSVNAVIANGSDVVNLEIDTPDFDIRVPIPVGPGDEAPDEAPVVEVAPPPPVRQDEVEPQE